MDVREETVMKMGQQVVRWGVIAVLVACFTGCGSVPITGRKQLRLVPSSQMMAASADNYAKFLKENPPSKNAKGQAMVRRVGTRIQAAVEEYMAGAGYADSLKNYDWQFNLVDDDQINAWAMPGGRVVVYSGLLKVAETEDGLAVVMGHEIAHAIAEHGTERVSQMMLAQAGSIALAITLSQQQVENPQLWAAAFGVGVQFGALLPYSRLHESEADELGLVFMSMAGYNPTASVGFWQRMSAAGGDKPPEVLSTHPSDATRIRKLSEQIPEVMPLYLKAKAEREAETSRALK